MWRADVKKHKVHNCFSYDLSIGGRNDVRQILNEHIKHVLVLSQHKQEALQLLRGFCSKLQS